jgi:hypothetical protein
MGCKYIDKVFDDKRLTVCLLMTWLIIVVVVFKDIGLLDTKFMTYGPSPHTVFMGVTLDTWYKWNMVAAFTFINTSINDFMSDAISPWILNTITDHKAKYLPYSKTTCLMISQLWSIYCNIMGVFGLFLAMTQVDFVLIRMVADLTVNVYTNLKFMRNKVTCPDRYRSDGEMTLMAMADNELTTLHLDKQQSGKNDCGKGMFTIGEDDLDSTESTKGEKV